MSPPTSEHGERLARLWAGDFGDDYVERNAEAGALREGWWSDLLGRLRPASVLEVGCNIGANLQWVASVLGPEATTGIDVNERALEKIRERIPGINAIRANASELPFEDRAFDLTFTMGVLIHQSPEDLPSVMAEVVRCADRFVMCVEYHADEEEEVPYRGETGALYRRDYGGLYAAQHPELRLLDQGFLPAEGDRRTTFDDATYWLFERPAVG